MVILWEWAFSYEGSTPVMDLAFPRAGCTNRRRNAMGSVMSTYDNVNLLNLSPYGNINLSNPCRVHEYTEKRAAQKALKKAGQPEVTSPPEPYPEPWSNLTASARSQGVGFDPQEVRGRS